LHRSLVGAAQDVAVARDIAEAAARAGGAIVRAALDGPAQVRNKGAVDLVTEVDLASEAAILALLNDRMPGVPVLAEEGGGASSAATRWVVDPLDGTTNFVHGFPSFGVSVALQQEGRIIAGCVYDPVRHQAYSAGRDLGAHCEGRPLRVSAVSSLDRALLLTGFAYDRRQRADFYLRFVKAFLEKSQGLRRAGSAAMDMCHVAAGRADGFWEFGLNVWDIAAGVLLIEEAGGRVSDMLGGPLHFDKPRLLATNGWVHAEMQEVLLPLLSRPAAMT
jgi:myo-inositol-1(or 4)-monophosphatase